jgi:hypothetical protein
MMRALKALSALALLAAVFLPMATCHDAHGHTTTFRVSDNGISGAAFFIWPVLFIAVELLVRRPRLVRVLIGLEPILIVISACYFWGGLGAIGLMTLGDVEVGPGTYVCEAGLAVYFCVAVIENIAPLRRKFNIIYLIGLCGNP